jgi:hypothetical protein
MTCVHPELLLISVDTQLQPLVSYFKGLGCSTCQVARLLQEVPQALGSRPPQTLFGARVEALRKLGVDGQQLREVTGRSTAWLTMKGAPHEQIAHLKEEMGFTTEQVRCWGCKGVVTPFCCKDIMRLAIEFDCCCLLFCALGMPLQKQLQVLTARRDLLLLLLAVSAQPGDSLPQHIVDTNRLSCKHIRKC